MDVILISIDSLRRDFLGAYRDRPWVVDYDVATPHLDRFAERAAVFDTHYAGSLPCMPARREWLAGIQEFLWRSWGPIEPFDRTIPRAARLDDILTTLITDHYHYFQHGSNGYFEDFNGVDFIRGHEYDAWETTPTNPDETFLEHLNAKNPQSKQFLNRSAYARNVATFDDEDDFFAPKVFTRGAEWIRDNQAWDQYFLYIDSFDVHEPFHCPERYASRYTDEDPRDPDLTCWPYYGRIEEGQSALDRRELEFVRSQFAGKVTMVDRQFGRIVDTLDESNLWDDTMVIVTSDHGYFLGDHGWIGKNDPPVYDVLARTPLFVWHPDAPRMQEHISALTSAIDLYATILEALDVKIPPHSHSRSLLPLLDGDDAHRDWAMYGYWGSAFNVTDGRHTYHHPTQERIAPYCHSTSMINPYGWFVPPKVQKNAESGRYLPYTESPVWRYKPTELDQPEEHLVVSIQQDKPLLFDTNEDPRQQENLIGSHPTQEERLRSLLVEAMDELEAPSTEFERLGLQQN